MKHIRVSIASGAAAAVILIGGVALAQSAAFPSQIGVGAQGTEVTSLQTWLENNGYYSGPVTGYFGTLTQTGVENFQSANGISATGYVGPLTLAALNAKASGSTSVSANSSTLAQLEAELDSLLAQIEALENNSTTSTTPSGTAMSVQANEGVSVSATLSASGTGPYTYSLSASPLNGAITSFNSQTGAFTYVPNANFTGDDTFTYTVGNGYGTSAPMTVTIDVIPTASTTSSTGTPVGQNLSFATANGAALNGTLTASSGTGPYFYSIATSPADGTITNFSPTTGAFTYIPNSGYNGNDSFTYVVGNGTATSSVAYTVDITD